MIYDEPVRILASSNAVDECLAEGGQDTNLEGRPTSLISPGNIAVLEFSALFPNLPNSPPGSRHDQLLTFTKDSKDAYGAHPTMDLRGRDGRGLWEPKVSSGYGYTITAAVDPKAIAPTGKAGIPNFIDVGFTDAVKPGISPTDPFYVRLGICYTDENGKHPAAGKFTVERGYKSWGGNGVNAEDKDLYFYWTDLEGRYNNQTCKNLDDDLRFCPDADPAHCVLLNLAKDTGCPADGFTRLPPDKTSCPNGTTKAQIAIPKGEWITGGSSEYLRVPQ